MIMVSGSTNVLDFVKVQDARTQLSRNFENLSQLQNTVACKYLVTDFQVLSVYTLSGPLVPTRKLEEVQYINGILVSPAVALAVRVFPVPCGPYSNAPYYSIVIINQC